MPSNDREITLVRRTLECVAARSTKAVRDLAAGDTFEVLQIDPQDLTGLALALQRLVTDFVPDQRLTTAKLKAAKTVGGAVVLVLKLSALRPDVTEADAPALIARISAKGVRASRCVPAETESPRKTLVSARQRASQFPLRPYMVRELLMARGVAASVRTVQRAVREKRQRQRAEALATVRYETAPGGRGRRR